MTDLQPLVAPTCNDLADLLASSPEQAWDTQSLCEKWQVRHVVAHMTMPARMSPEQYGAEMAAAGGDFSVLSETVAARDASRPADELLAELRSASLHAWQPPGGGAIGALSHAVIHSLDITIPLGQSPVAPQDALVAVLDALAGAEGAWFGVDLTQTQLVATDVSWSWGSGTTIHADSGPLVALLAGRTLPDGRSLPRR